jgi:hypothetical protein
MPIALDGVRSTAIVTAGNDLVRHLGRRRRVDGRTICSGTIRNNPIGSGILPLSDHCIPALVGTTNALSLSPFYIKPQRKKPFLELQYNAYRMSETDSRRESWENKGRCFELFIVLLLQVL